MTTKAKKPRRACISVNLKDSDRDIEHWLEGKQEQMEQDHGIRPSLSQVVMANLRKQMKAEQG